MKFCKNDIDQLLILLQEKNVRLEGNILKVLEDGGNEEFREYLKSAIEQDNLTRTKRLRITKKIQSQNKDLIEKEKSNENLMSELKTALASSKENTEIVQQQNLKLLDWKEKNEKLQSELKEALQKAETAKKSAEEDLDILQKKSQYELIGTIVKVALLIIIGVAILSTIMFGIAIFTNREIQLIGNTWSNMLGILLTNAFSIVGTITGVKYADNVRLKSKEKD
jgi:hypothetical protein